MAEKDDVGRQGEALVADVLAARGWEILDRNWRCPLGEIDIAARDGDEFVVVEVKTRRSRAFGTAAEAVTSAKLARLRRLAAAYLDVHDAGYDGVRVDVVAVEFEAGRPTIEHLRGVA